MFDHLVRTICLFLLCIFCLAPTTNAQNAVAPTNLNYPNPTSAVDQKDDFQKNVVDHKGTTRRRLTCTASTITECCDTAAISGLCTGNTGGVGDVDCSKEATNNFNKGSKVQGSTASECCEPVPGVQASNNVLLTSSNCASLGGEMRSPQTKLECESAGRELQVNLCSTVNQEKVCRPEARVITTNTDSPKCYYSVNQRRLVFNTDTSNTAACSSYSNCICVLLCQPGTFQDEPNKITCKSCRQDKGEYSTAGRSNCEYTSKSCPKGTYASGTAACTACEPGKYNDVAGQTSEASCKKCPFDTYYDEYEIGLPQEDCKTCPINERPTINQKECMPVGLSVPPYLCRRDNTSICRGTTSKFVEVDLSWIIPPLQEKENGLGIKFSAFGDIDDDGDIDMVSVVETVMASKENNWKVELHLIAYENTAGKEPGTPPIWVEKDTIATGLLGPDYGTNEHAGASLSLVDLNHDNKIDIVYSKTQGPVTYYKNTGETNRAEWKKVNETTTESPFAEMIQFTNTDSKIATKWGEIFYPIVVYIDLDDDGDLDIIRGRTTDGQFYFENVAADKKAPIYQQNGGMIIAATANGKYENVLGMTLGDLDHDGDLDLIIGGELMVHVLENTGSRKHPAWTKRSEAWMGFDSSGFAESESASRPDFVEFVIVQQMIDIDLDGKLEFVYTTNYKMKFFRQTKASGLSTFVQRTEWDLKDTNFATVKDGNRLEFIDATFAAVDLNGDGHQDLVVGAETCNNSGNCPNLDNWLTYYLFEKIGINGIEYSEKKILKDKDGKAIIAYRPIFMDVNLDGIPDLLIRIQGSAPTTNANSVYTLKLYMNTATSSSDPFQFEEQTTWVNPFNDDVRYFFGQLVHLDNDNILDFMTNEGKMYKHNSDGSFSRQEAWEINNNGFGDAVESRIFTFGDVDLDGDDDAVVGTGDGKLEYYERIQLVPPKWIKRDKNYGWSLADFDLGLETKPVLVDYDKDGDLDLIVANYAGNVFLFEQGTCASSCTSSGSCNYLTEHRPTCSCSFQGGTDGRSCNSW